MANLYDEVKRIKAAIENHSGMDPENEYDLAAMLAYNCDANWEFGSEDEGYCPWYGPLPKTKEMLYTVANRSCSSSYGKEATSNQNSLLERC